MINDNNIVRAVHSIQQRSEKDYDERLINSFVDIGIIDIVKNTNNQMIFGRRGTGKTHLLKALNNMMKTEGYLTVYVDCRTFGSAQSVMDANLPPFCRAMHIFKDLLNVICNEITQFSLTDKIKPNIRDNAVELINTLIDCYNEYAKSYNQIVSKEKNKTVNKSDRGIAFQKEPYFNTQSSHIDEEEAELQVAYSQKEQLSFPNIYAYLTEILSKLNIDLFISIDEWVSIPKEIQPFLAEYLKRCLFVCKNITIKIASIEYGTQLMNRNMGMEIGSDICNAITLDDFYVFEKQRNNVIMYFKDVLYKHISSELEKIEELEKDYLIKKHNVKNGNELIGKLFSQKDGFDEVIRASEGVTRDFIQIIAKSILKSKTEGKTKINKITVKNVASEWFESDKRVNLKGNSQEFLSAIMNEVIGNKHARCFMVEQKYSNHNALQALYDYRVIHLLRKGYSSKSFPGKRYNIFTLDYGTYVNLRLQDIQKKKEQIHTVQASMFDDDYQTSQNNYNEYEDENVPLDDKRSIRSIILNERILNKFDTVKE